MLQTSRSPRWLKLLAGYQIEFIVNGYFFTWSMLSIFFSAKFPEWTPAQLAMNGTICIAASSVASFTAPWFLRHMSPRAVTRISGAIYFSGFLPVLLLWRMPCIWLLYIGFALMGYANGLVYPVLGQVLTAWYPEHSGTVSGGLLLATGVGSLFIGALEEWIANSAGLFILCVVLMLSITASHFFGALGMVYPPEWTMAGHKKGTKENRVLYQAMRVPVFWLFFAWLIVMASSGLLVINNSASIFAFYNAPATVGMLSMLITGIGCQLMGVAIDHLGLRASLLTFSMFALLACVVLLTGHYTGWTILILLGVLLSAISYGSTTSAKMAGVIRLYGNRNMTSFFAVLNLNVLIASFAGPYISGVLLMLNQGYYLVFLFMLVLVILGLANVVFAWKLMKTPGDQMERGSK